VPLPTPAPEAAKLGDANAIAAAPNRIATLFIIRLIEKTELSSEKRDVTHFVPKNIFTAGKIPTQPTDNQMK